MGRLIDADELLVAMDTWDKFGYDDHNRLIRLDKRDEEYVPYVHYDDMIYCINSMTTAYDVDKVMGELEKARREYNGDGAIGVACGLALAKSIIREVVNI